jgi:hypothetical protein
VTVTVTPGTGKVTTHCGLLQEILQRNYLEMLLPGMLGRVCLRRVGQAAEVQLARLASLPPLSRTHQHLEDERGDPAEERDHRLLQNDEQ